MQAERLLIMDGLFILPGATREEKQPFLLANASTSLLC